MDAGMAQPGFVNSGQMGCRVSETASVPWSPHRDGREAPLSPQPRALLRFWGAGRPAAGHRGAQHRAWELSAWWWGDGQSTKPCREGAGCLCDPGPQANTWRLRLHCCEGRLLCLSLAALSTGPATSVHPRREHPAHPASAPGPMTTCFCGPSDVWEVLAVSALLLPFSW